MPKLCPYNIVQGDLHGLITTKPPCVFPNKSICCGLIEFIMLIPYPGGFSRQNNNKRGTRRNVRTGQSGCVHSRCKCCLFKGQKYVCRLQLDFLVMVCKQTLNFLRSEMTIARKPFIFVTQIESYDIKRFLRHAVYVIIYLF